MSITDLYISLFGRTKIRDGDVISMGEHGRAGGVSTGQAFKFTDGVNYAMKLTEDGSITYIAWANPGTLESAAKWKVMKLNGTTGLVITWANGDTNFDNIATDLTTLTYS